MKKLILSLFILSFLSCGIIIDTDEDESLYTYILKNETGVTLEITGDFDEKKELIEDGNIFMCSYYATIDNVNGLCSDFIEIKIPNTNLGYRCYDTDQTGDLCFVEDLRLFTIFGGTIFTETSHRIYEYTLTPDLLENAFELPEE